MSARSSQKPWPMKWVALAILVFIAAYTVITLTFRKPGTAYQPFHDARARETEARLTSAGYTRILTTAERPAESRGSGSALQGAAAAVHPMPGGVPPELKETLLDHPRLPQAFSQVRAAGTANQLLPYTIEFTCALPDHKQLLAGATVYRKEDDVAIVADFELIEGDLLARTKESLVQVSLPAGALPLGNYRITLIGERESKQWDVQVH